MNVEKMLMAIDRILAEARKIKTEIYEESAPKPVPGFDEFWKAYPIRARQMDTENSWALYVKETDVPLIMNALKHKIWPVDKKWIPSADRWLAGRRWLDENTKGHHGKYAGCSETIPEKD